MNRRFTTEFIETYKSLPQLWQIGSEDYKNKCKRAEAYNRLVAVTRKYHSPASLDFVKRKINNLRTCFRKEMNRMIHSRNTGDKIYETNWLYYDMLSFIMDQQESSTGDYTDGATYATMEPVLSDLEVGRTIGANKIYSEALTLPVIGTTWTGISGLRVLVLEGNRHSNGTGLASVRGSREDPLKEEEVDSLSLISETQSPIFDQPSYHSNKRIREMSPGPSTEVTCSKSSEEDVFDHVGKNVAAKLRGMDRTQRIIAEKLISDVLYSGQLDLLSKDACLTLSST
uniref:MADF domain-containing protein n=1 Tax=Timema poppense TaxID=170557 RepID=A0A7R9H6I1_TIMPO|nr:unnamed protein product [Timema poppensis]